MSGQAEFFDLVKATTGDAKAAGVLDYLRDRKGTSKATQRNYVRLAKARLRVGGMDGVSSASYHAMRAAVSFTAAAVYREARKAADDARRAGDPERASREAQRAREAVDTFVSARQSVRPEGRSKRRSKRSCLPRWGEWQADVLELATPVQRPGVAVMWATGARPAEIEKGVRLEWTATTDGLAICATIEGAKVSEVAGQPWRRVYVDPRSPAGEALAAVLDGQASSVVQRGAKRLNKDCEAIRAKGGPAKVSPYSFRHQLAADLKAMHGQEGAALTAAALGHATTRMQGRYGSVQQGRGGHVLGAETAVEVRSTPRRSHDPVPSAPGSSPA